MNKLAVLSVLCCLVLGPAQAASLSGIVSDEDGNPVIGARAGLKYKPDNSAVTDENGKFTISNLKARGINAVKISRSSLEIKNGKLFFNTSRAVEKATVSIFSLNGALISSMNLSDCAAGTHQIPLEGKLHATSVIRLRLDDGEFVSKVAPGTNAAFSGSSADAFTAVKSAAATAASDTLIITAPGYRHVLKEIDSYETADISCVLSRSNPWKPSGSDLVHEGQMVKIMAKGYDFEMGQPDKNFAGISPTSEMYTAENEVAAHTVKFTYDFWMDTTEVTQKDFSALMSRYPSYADQYDEMHKKGDDYPAYKLNNYDAMLYCNARSIRDGLDTVYSFSEIIGVAGQLSELLDLKADLSKNGYRLPTEAEWEYACKGGTSSPYYWQTDGESIDEAMNDSAEIGKYAVWSANSYDLGQTNDNFGVHKVAGKLPNAYGLYDMIGNVYEACNDYWEDNYAWGEATDPAGPEYCDYFTSRGGAWGTPAWFLRSTCRLPYAPDYIYFYMGLRAVKPVK